MKYTYCKTKILCNKLINYSDKYTEMHGQQNKKKKSRLHVSYLQVQYVFCIIHSKTFILFTLYSNMV